MTSSRPSSHLTTAVSPECPPLHAGNWQSGLRSLWHLSRHLTARADDNHAAPPRMWLPTRLFPGDPSAVQARVRFLAYHRIKPHVPPLVRAPVNSFEFLAADSISPTAGVHRLRCGLPGYLILFDTRTFEHQRQSRPSRLLSQSGFFVISKHFTATPRIPPASAALKKASFNCNFTVEPQTFTADLTSRLRSL